MVTTQPIPMTRLRKRDGDGGPDDLFDDRRVDGDPRGDLGRPVLLEEAGRQPQQVAVHCKPDVGHRPLAEPGDEIIADGGRDREDGDDPQQQLEPGRDRVSVGGAPPKALVDDRA